MLGRDYYCEKAGYQIFRAGSEYPQTSWQDQAVVFFDIDTDKEILKFISSVSNNNLQQNLPTAKFIRREGIQ